MSDARAGQCLCGAVRFTARPKAGESGVCHCGMCRRWSGGVMFMVDCEGAVDFAPDAPVKTYTSSDWGERLFCGDCGTNLAWRTRDGGHSVVSAMCFDEAEDFPLAHQIYIDEKPAIYDLAQQTPMMTGAQVMAMFAPQEDGQ